MNELATWTVQWMIKTRVSMNKQLKLTILIIGSLPSYAYTRARRRNVGGYERDQEKRMFGLGRTRHLLFCMKTYMCRR